MRVLFCGDREWQDDDLIRWRLELYNPDYDTIVHGAARGADRIAGKIAKEMGFNVEAYPANWNRYGKSAGPRRNKQMLDSGIHKVEAFHDDIENSKGTKNMVIIARRAKKEVIINRHVTRSGIV